MTDRTDAKRPDEDEDRPTTPPKEKPASKAPPVSGPNAPASGDADKTDSNRKGGYGTG